MKFSVLIVFFCLIHVSLSQNKSVRLFDADLEFRPRLEFLEGYGGELPNDTTNVETLFSTRTRLNFRLSKNRFSLYSSLQNISRWRSSQNSNTPISLSVFELFLKYKISNYSVLKVGRQAIEIDNGRLFSKANWSQTSRSHQAINWILEKDSINNQLIVSYRNPLSSDQWNSWWPGTPDYNYMLTEFIEFKKTDWKFYILSTTEALRAKEVGSPLYVRSTIGGRLTNNFKGLTSTFAGFYQFGQSSSSIKVRAFYLQPEVSYEHKKFTFKLGAEYLSGSNYDFDNSVSRSFSTLYGVAFKFMGYLNYFTSFPSDLKGSGLINPYFSSEYKFSEQIKFRAESHLFFSANGLETEHPEQPRYLAFEEDFKFKYKINDWTSLDVGFAFMLASEAMELIKTGDSFRVPTFGFIMFTLKPTFRQILNARKKNQT